MSATLLRGGRDPRPRRRSQTGPDTHRDNPRLRRRQGLELQRSASSRSSTRYQSPHGQILVASCANIQHRAPRPAARLTPPRSDSTCQTFADGTSVSDPVRLAVATMSHPTCGRVVLVRAVIACRDGGARDRRWRQQRWDDAGRRPRSAPGTTHVAALFSYVSDTTITVDGESGYAMLFWNWFITTPQWSCRREGAHSEVNPPKNIRERRHRPSRSRSCVPGVWRIGGESPRFALPRSRAVGAMKSVGYWVQISDVPCAQPT